ncbi:hypothetical protein Peur_009418 [Populus x canadensis]
MLALPIHIFSIHLIINVRWWPGGSPNSSTPFYYIIYTWVGALWSLMSSSTSPRFRVYNLLWNIVGAE